MLDYRELSRLGTYTEDICMFCVQQESRMYCFGANCEAISNSANTPHADKHACSRVRNRYSALRDRWKTSRTSVFAYVLALSGDSDVATSYIRGLEHVSHPKIQLARMTHIILWMHDDVHISGQTLPHMLA